MNFDQWWTDDEGEVADKPPVGPGRQSGQIVRVKTKQLSFMSDTDKNPDGTSLVIGIDVSGHQELEAIVPAHWRTLVTAICRAARVAPPQRGEDWDEQQLVGQFVAIDCETGTSKTGREYTRVARWHPQTEPLPPAGKASTPRVQPDRRAKVTAADPDDIPF